MENNQTQKGHWDFTVKEWSQPDFLQFLNIAFAGGVEVVYDIGANVGGVSKVILDNFTPKNIYCFEPDKDNMDFLREKLGEQVNSVPFGVFYGEREAKVFGRGDNNIGGYFVEQVCRPLGGNTVPTGKIFELRKLEELNLPIPDLIKMDVEGSEKNIIENSTIVKNTKYIIVEWHYNTPAKEFFDIHLPNHEIIYELNKIMYLLCLK